jgi:hypothetical protein
VVIHIEPHVSRQRLVLDAMHSGRVEALPQR